MDNDFEMGGALVGVFYAVLIEAPFALLFWLL